MPKIDFTQLTALVIEDHDFIRSVVRNILRAFGMPTVLEAADARDGLALATEHKPSVILCDIGMKPLNGFDFVINLRAEGKPFSDTPVIFLTAHDDPEVVHRAKTMRAAGYLLKPVGPKKLRQTVETVLSGEG